MTELIKTNKYQTPITEELLSSYPDEVREQFMDAISTIPLIQNLISPSRPAIETLPRDSQGRAIIDITNPPTFEDADWFRQPALFFLKNGCYTFLRPNSNPNSEYRKYWDREIDRCYNGLLRETDGMYIPGYLYWFLNYCPMMINKYKEGQKKAIRTEGFAYFFEGIWWRYLYLKDARDKGHHAVELAKRGCAKSYGLASIMSHNLIIGESEESKRRTITVLTAYQKEYLKDDKDGTLSKFVPILSFLSKNTPFPRLMLKQSSNEMTWQMGYKDEYGRNQGSLNQVMGVSAKDDSDKLRGKRGYILFEEFGNFPSLLDLYDVTRKSVEDGDYTFALMYLIGTANNKEANFQSAKTLLYATESYNITPAEAIIKVKDAYFPVAALNERAQQLDTNPHIYDDIYVGELFFNNSNQVEFKPTGDIPIRKFPVDNDTKGALEIYVMPEKDSTGTVFDNRYILGYDPTNNDQAESHSLASVFVFDLFTDRIVAEFTGRTEFADDMHEIVRKLCLFYNGKVLYESNIKGCYSYMEKMHSTYLLADTPQYLRDKQIIKYSGFGSSAKGVSATASVNNFANRLIKDWFNKLVPIERTDENGNKEIIQTPSLYLLKTRALIEEAIQFNPEINVDRIRALGMVMLYREEYIILYGNNLNRESREKVRKDDPSNDPFFRFKQ